MQGSIAEQIRCIETLMTRQASSHAAEIALQHARFEAALDNMTLGLCMFDSDGDLLVHNRRFVWRCSRPRRSAPASPNCWRGSTLHAPVPAPVGQNVPTSHAFSCQLADGRTISVAEEAMAGGGRVVTYEDITERRRAEGPPVPYGPSRRPDGSPQPRAVPRVCRTGAGADAAPVAPCRSSVSISTGSRR